MEGDGADDFPAPTRAAWLWIVWMMDNIIADAAGGMLTLTMSKDDADGVRGSPLLGRRTGGK